MVLKERDYSLGKISKRWNYFRKHFQQLTDEQCLIEFYVGNKENYRSSPHTDRGRTVAINIPIKVDIENSTAFFGKHSDLSEYPAPKDLGYNFKLEVKQTDFKAETNARYQGDYVEDLYDHVILDSPVLFNPAVPHGGWNRSNDSRVLMSLSFDSISYEQAHKKCVEMEYKMMEELLENPVESLEKYHWDEIYNQDSGEFLNKDSGDTEIIRVVAKFLKNPVEARKKLLKQVMEIDARIGYWGLNR